MIMGALGTDGQARGFGGAALTRQAFFFSGFHLERGLEPGEKYLGTDMSAGGLAYGFGQNGSYGNLATDRQILEL